MFWTEVCCVVRRIHGTLQQPIPHKQTGHYRGCDPWGAALPSGYSRMFASSFFQKESPQAMYLWMYSNTHARAHTVFPRFGQRVQKHPDNLTGERGSSFEVKISVPVTEATQQSSLPSFGCGRCVTRLSLEGEAKTLRSAALSPSLPGRVSRLKRGLLGSTLAGCHFLPSASHPVHPCTVRRGTKPAGIGRQPQTPLAGPPRHTAGQARAPAKVFTRCVALGHQPSGGGSVPPQARLPPLPRPTQTVRRHIGLPALAPTGTNARLFPRPVNARRGGLGR